MIAPNYSLDRGPWIQTASGRRFYLLDPSPEDVAIEDIADALSNLCIAGGRVRAFYSLAQRYHHISEIVPTRIALWGLLGGAAKVYLADAARTLTHQLAESHVAYDGIARDIGAAIMRRFRLHTLSSPDQALVSKAYLVALATEVRDLHARPRGDLPQGAVFEGIEPDDEVLVPWSPAAARTVFLDRFAQLTRRGT